MNLYKRLKDLASVNKHSIDKVIIFIEIRQKICNNSNNIKMSCHYENRKVVRGSCGDENGRVRGRSTLSTIHTKKTLEDYLFYVVPIKQESDYEIMAEFVSNHIKKTFYQINDVSEVLQTLLKSYTYVWKPTLYISSNIDASIK